MYIIYCVIPSCCLAENNDYSRKKEYVRNIILEEKIPVKLLTFPISKFRQTVVWKRTRFINTPVKIQCSSVARKQTTILAVFRRELSENCPLLGHYAASGGNSLLMFRGYLSVPS